MQIDMYKTKDLAEAAALIVKKLPLISIERDCAICWFVFENKKECQLVSNRFFFGELQVNAREYQEAMARLKNRIFAQT